VPPAARSTPHAAPPHPPPAPHRQVSAINLAGLDRVIAAFAAGDTEDSLLLRQYRLRLKKGAHPKVRGVPRRGAARAGPGDRGQPKAWDALWASGPKPS
jgi:hypothetical protein